MSTTGTFASGLKGWTFVPQGELAHGTKIGTKAIANTADEAHIWSSEGVIANSSNPNLVVSFPQDNNHAPLPAGSVLEFRDVTYARWKIVKTPKSAQTHTNVFLQNLHPFGYVVDVRDKHTSAGTDIIGWSLKENDPINQSWTFSNASGNNVAITSQMTGLALTVRGQPGRGSQLEIHPIGADGPTPNQLWNFTPHGFIQLAAAPNLVLSLPLEESGEPQTSTSKRPALLVLEDISLSLWKQVDSSKPEFKFYTLVYHPRAYAIDIRDQKAAPNIDIIGWPKKEEAKALNQLWAFHST